MSGQRNWVLLEEIVHYEYEKCASVQKRVKKVGEPTGEGAAVTRLGGPKLRRRNMRLFHLWMVITVWGLLLRSWAELIKARGLLIMIWGVLLTV